MEFIVKPMEIETKSMQLIAPYLTATAYSEEEKKIVSRMIHAAGDPDYANHVEIHPGAIAAGKQALLGGADIYTDVEMVRTGINKTILAALGGSVHCRIADADIAATAKAGGITRSMAALRSFGKALDGQIIAIGNAPTALFEVIRLMQEENLRPALIIGIPVGFVGAAESKQYLSEVSPVPFITVKGTKGGSPIAASAVNALLYLLRERD
ncbi:MAG: precorrin-8X methylmutase [Sporomusaceae bacterium]|nr:precorrin-8X methylmutase [Sporomusaceae bacterium]